MLITLSDADPRPIYTQIVAQVKEQVARGALKPGDELPGVRELAESIGINLHTAHKAYRELRDAGVIHLRLGRRARVAAPATRKPTRSEVDAALGNRLGDLITDALTLQVTPDEFRAMVDDMLTRRQKEMHP